MIVDTNLATRTDRRRSSPSQSRGSNGRAGPLTRRASPQEVVSFAESKAQSLSIASCSPATGSAFLRNFLAPCCTFVDACLERRNCLLAECFSCGLPRRLFPATADPSRAKVNVAEDTNLNR